MNREALLPRFPVPQGLAFAFFGTFARCEYALKSGGVAKGNGSKVEPNWEGFADSIHERFSEVTDVTFRQSVAFLLAEPPRKQVLLNGRLSWKNAPPRATDSTARQALMLVRRVRNNLFHGGKIWSPDHYGPRNRDEQLVRASLEILHGCIRLHDEVNYWFTDGA